jgi:hypothetical protein
MGHGRRVQTGVPMTHLSPETSLYVVFHANPSNELGLA